MFRKITRRLSNEKAFTLIEVIVSLVLVGIIAAVAGLGLVKSVKGMSLQNKTRKPCRKFRSP